MEFSKKELFRSGPGIGLILGFVLFGGVLDCLAETSGDSRWSFSAGYKHRYNIDTDLHGGSSYSAGQYGTIAGPAPVVTGIGPDNATADRDYDDGYVYKDVATDVPGPLQGLTGNYEYAGASQYDPAADTLSFTKAAAGPYNGISSPAFQEFEDQANGINLRFDYQLIERKSLRLSAVLTASYFVEEDRSTRWSDYSASVQTVTDTYDLQGVDPSVRENPNLDGTLYGAPSGTGDPRPVIDNIPSSRTVWNDLYSNTVNYDYDYDMATVGLGLELQWAVHERVSLYVSPQIERYRMDIDTSREEVITDGAGAVQDRWTDQTSDQEYFWGVVLEGGVQVALTEKWFVRVHGDALKTWDSVDVQTGPTSMSMDMSGWSWGCDLGVRF